MLYRKFGKTNEMVSNLGFGCMRLPLIEGGDTSMIDYEKATSLVRHAIDMGVNYVDTAYPYHGKNMGSAGESEPFLAKALKDGYREKVKIATKLPTWLVKTREDMDTFLDEQLKRLDTTYIDFYLVHALDKERYDKLKQLGVDDFLNSSIKSGKIKYAGFSFHGEHDDFQAIVDGYDWSFCQIQYNYLDVDYQAGLDGLNYLASKRIGIVIMEPLKGGKLAGTMPQEVQELFAHASSQGTPAEWALRWIWNHPEVSIVLSGMNSESQVDENLRIAGDAIPDCFTDEDFEVIRQAKTIFDGKTKVSCTECGYCMPCPQGVNIPGCFKHYNNFFIWGNDGAYHRFFEDKQKASACIECGQCEAACPQSIPIMELLKDVHRVLV